MRAGRDHRRRRDGVPAEFQGASEERIADLGVGKLVTFTSTYDHRIIQGAESGDFLRTVHELLLTTTSTRSSASWASRTSRCAGAPTTRTRSTTTAADRVDRGLPQPRPPDGRHRPAAAGQDRFRSHPDLDVPPTA